MMQMLFKCALFDGNSSASGVLFFRFPAAPVLQRTHVLHELPTAIPTGRLFSACCKTNICLLLYNPRQILRCLGRVRADCRCSSCGEALWVQQCATFFEAKLGRVLNILWTSVLPTLGNNDTFPRAIILPSVKTLHRFGETGTYSTKALGVAEA